MSNITKQDTNGVKPLLGVGEFGYDNYPAGGDVGRVFVGTGSANIALAKKSEVDTAVATTNAHTVRVDNPHAVTKAQVGLSNADNTSDNVKNVLSATKWAVARTVTLSGDVAGSANIDGSANVTITTTVQPNSIALGADTTGNYVAGTTAGAGVTVSGTPGEGWSPTIALTDVGTVGTYTKVTTNSKGQITVGGTLVAEDIPNLDTSKITTGTLPVDRGGTGVTTVTGTGSVVLNTSPALVTPNIGIAIGTSFNSITGLASVAPLVAGTAAVGTSTLTARQDHVHPVQTTISGNAGTATKLATARTINGVSFDGSANITVVDSTKAPLASPTFTGTPIAPTAAADTSTTQLATTAFAIPRVTGVDNAIVRFDGETGKVQTSNITIDDSGNIGSGTQTFNGFGGTGFKNYIINGNFEINQRNSTLSSNSTTNTSGIFMDMWRYANTANTSSMYLSQDTITYNGTTYKALKATVPKALTNTGVMYSVYTSIEDNTACKLQNKVFTVSFLAEVNNAGTYSFNIRKCNDDNSITSSFVKLIPLVIGINKVVITVPADSAYISPNAIGGRGLNIIFGACVSNDSNTTEGWVSGNFATHLNTFKWWNIDGGYLKIARFQLEEGSIATPFEQRPYGLELSLCQRYCFNPKHGANEANQVVGGDAYGIDAVNGLINFKFPVSMRAAPSLYLSNGVSSLSLGYPESIQLTSLTQSVCSCNESVFVYNVTSGSTTFKHYHLYMPNASHQILFTSEI